MTLLSFIKFIQTIPFDERKNCQLKLIGTGPEKAFYQKIIEENQAEDCVEIIEWIDRTELMKIYETSSVFLFPSHEGAGMVVAEALSFGLPVICLDNEGPGEFINTDCGFAIPHSDYTNTICELENAIQTLYYDKELLLKMSVAARKQYEEKFTWNSRGEKLKNIYNQL